MQIILPARKLCNSSSILPSPNVLPPKVPISSQGCKSNFIFKYYPLVNRYIFRPSVTPTASFLSSTTDTTSRLVQEQSPQVVYSKCRKRATSPPQIFPVILVEVVVGASLGISRMLEFRLDLNRPRLPWQIHSREAPEVIKKFRRGGRYVILYAFDSFFSKLKVDNWFSPWSFLSEDALPRLETLSESFWMSLSSNSCSCLRSMNCISGLFSNLYILISSYIHTIHIAP